MLPLDRRPIEHPSAATAAAATVWTLGVPAITFLLLLATSGAHAPAVVAGGVTGLASLGAIAVGSRWWHTRPESRSLSFAQLMMWTWFRRARALRTVERSLQLLDGGSPARQLEVLRELSAALESKDRYTHGHSRRVRQHAIRTALEMNSNLRPDEIDDLAQAATLHDVGKIEIPDSILHKEGALSPRELSTVKWHTVVGAQLVARTGNRRVAQSVLHHHESWDGTGYPHGLSGEDIPLYSRIIAVADAFDAMTSSRPYRSSLGRRRAVDVLTSEAGRQFDPRVVDAFLRSLPTHASAAIMLPGLANAMREIGGWARRVGLASTAPGAAGAVVAAVVGTAVLSLAPSPVAPKIPVATGVDAQSPPTAPSPGAQAADPPAADKESERRQGRGRPVSILAAQHSAPLGESTSPLSPLDPGSGAPHSPGRTGPPNQPSPPAGADPSPPPAQDPAPAPSPEPSPPPAPSEEPSEGGDPGGSDPGGSDPGPGGKPSPGGGDPNPDKGKDCEQPPPSKGNEKHCGGNP